MHSTNVIACRISLPNLRLWLERFVTTLPCWIYEVLISWESRWETVRGVLEDWEAVEVWHSCQGGQESSTSEMHGHIPTTASVALLYITCVEVLGDSKNSC